MTPTIRFRRLADADPEIPLPRYESSGAAGADIRANFPVTGRQGLRLDPGLRALVPTGLACEIPNGYELQVRPRSGLALRHGLTLVNTPGTIDSDYRGPLGVLMINLGNEPATIAHGDRIAQLVMAPVVQSRFEIADQRPDTARGQGGFGSTGTA